MSVALLVSKIPKSLGDEYHPIATEGGYITLWNPIIRELKLQWMPLFLPGTSVDREDLCEVIQELELFVAAVATRKERESAYMAVYTRAQALLERLQALKSEAFLDIFIG